MRFSNVLSVVLCVLLLELVQFSPGTTVQGAAQENTPDPWEDITNRILTERMIDNRISNTAGVVSVFQQTKFWIGPARVSVWDNSVDVDLFLGELFVNISFVPPYKYCKSFKVYMHWWYGTAYDFIVWSYPSRSCI